MAKCIYIYSRKAHSESIRSLLGKICNRLAPDNIVPAEPLIKISGCLAYAAINPNGGLLETNNSLLLGQVFDESKKWNEPLEEFPDGSYAVSYTHLRAHETPEHLVCRLLLEKKKK